MGAVVRLQLGRCCGRVSAPHEKDRVCGIEQPHQAYRGWLCFVRGKGRLSETGSPAVRGGGHPLAHQDASVRFPPRSKSPPGLAGYLLVGGRTSWHTGHDLRKTARPEYNITSTCEVVGAVYGWLREMKCPGLHDLMYLCLHGPPAVFEPWSLVWDLDENVPLSCWLGLEAVKSVFAGLSAFPRLLACGGRRRHCIWAGNLYELPLWGHCVAVWASLVSMIARRDGEMSTRKSVTWVLLLD
ncbi:hypothetical protein QBC35DRAFT_530150 [Podospora australis]|uniref:Uncharacterized protein n=1 Tax=Podospora australis TaxID=1536484 RepID=A0AAN6WY43_9PEZI|nr:hypothetical protein QBC35DRAFT_530150 [Podospora australis]